MYTCIHEPSQHTHTHTECVSRPLVLADITTWYNSPSFLLASIQLDTLERKEIVFSIHQSLTTFSMQLFTTTCMYQRIANLPSPCTSVYWNACTRRRVSSTERPTYTVTVYRVKSSLSSFQWSQLCYIIGYVRTLSSHMALKVIGVSNFPGLKHWYLKTSLSLNFGY